MKSLVVALPRRESLVRVGLLLSIALITVGGFTLALIKPVEARSNHESTMRVRGSILDAAVLFSSYLGGSGLEVGEDIALDESGNIYVTGWVTSTNFPTRNPFQATLRGAQDVFVTKLNPSGTQIIYSTYFGGTGSDAGQHITVDGAGNAYIVGTTTSTDLPLQNPYQPTRRGSGDGFLMKLSADGTTLVYSTYLGGSQSEGNLDVAVDRAGNTYVAGTTSSSDYPTTINGYQKTIRGITDIFVTKFNSSGTGLVYSTYIGGSNTDRLGGIALDPAGNAYTAGSTSSTNFPVRNPYRSTRYNTTGDDMFVTKLNSTGADLVYSTYFGGNFDDECTAIAVDNMGNAYITGITLAIPTTSNAYQPGSRGGWDAFITKFNPSGSSLAYSSYVAASGTDFGQAIAVDSTGSAYIGGQTDSLSFPVQNGYQTSNGGSFDAFVAKVNTLASGQASLAYSTYFGGLGPDRGFGITAMSGNAYIIGSTDSANFPTANPAQPNLAGVRDAFVAGLGTLGNATPTPTPTCTATTPITTQGDDIFTMTINSSCNINADLKIGRYYGPTNGSGHLLPSVDGVSVLGDYVDSQAELTISYRPAGQPVQVGFAGMNFILPAGQQSVEQVYRTRVDTQALVLPNAKGMNGATPVPGINTISITQTAPAEQRAVIRDVKLTLHGMRPLVLVAGIDLRPGNHDLKPTDTYWKPETWHQNYPYSAFAWSPLQDRHASVPQGGQNLILQITLAKLEFGVTKVNVAAHSQGGLWTRAYALRGDTRDSIDNFIMVGTPNIGSFWADTFKLSYDGCANRLGPICLGIRAWYEGISPAISNLTTWYMLDYNAQDRAARCVHYYDLAGETRTVLNPGVPLRTDGMVFTFSVQGLTYSEHLTPIAMFPQLTVHNLEPQHPEFQNAMKDYYSLRRNHYYYNSYCLGSSRPLGIQQQQSVVATPIASNWPVISSSVSHGATKSFTMTMDTASDATFTLGWLDYPTATLSLALTDPLGEVITATSTYSGSTYLAQMNGVGYQISSPIAGTWQMTVSGENVPNGEENFYLGGQLTGGVQLNAQISSSFTTIGHQVALTSTLQDTAPITGALAMANVTLSGDANYTQTISMANQGNGVYTGVFTPTISGTYDVVLLASGTNHLGQSFSRLNALQLQATSGAALTGAFTEQATDTSGDGLYDKLVIISTAVITQAGQYRLSGRLTTPGDEELTTSTGLYTLTVGTQQLPLSFDGSQIGSGLADGPFQLRNLMFTQIASDELTVANQQLAYTTHAYSKYSWPRQNVVKTGDGMAAGVDTNQNGLYEWLQVRMPMDVREAGVYSASLNLMALDGTTITTAAAGGLNLTQGANDVVILISGPIIRAAGMAGPYTVQDLVLWRNGETGGGSYIEGALVQTDGYQSSDFEKGLVGHVVWQGRPAQPDAKQALPITLTLKLGESIYEYPVMNTDPTGFFTVTVGTLPNGLYSWWVKGPGYLANSGSLTLSEAPIANQEMGVMKTGDVNNDNVIDITDFSLLRATFGKVCGDTGYNGNADLTGDCVVDITDFSLLRGNFGQSGAPPLGLQDNSSIGNHSLLGSQANPTK